MPLVDGVVEGDVVPAVHNGENVAIKGKFFDDLANGIVDLNDDMNATKASVAALQGEVAGKQDALTTSADLSISDNNELSLTDMAKKRLFIDLWNGTYPNIDWINYNEDTGYFEINPTMFGNKVGLTDISYDEAVQIYNRTCDSAALETPYNTANIRINLPPYNYHNPVYDGEYCHARYNNNIKTLLMAASENSHCKGVYTEFRALPKLESIVGVIPLAPNRTFNFIDCPMLKDVKVHITGNNCTISLINSPLVSIASFQYIITNAPQVNLATIIVHPDVYAKFTGDITNEAAAALSAEELAQWQQLMTDATAKNISIIEAT